MIWSWNQIFRENSADTEEVIAKGADEKEDLKFGQSFTSFVESQVHNWFQKYGSVSEGNTSLKVRCKNSYTFGEIESSPLRSLTLTISSLFRNMALQAVYRVFYSSNGIFCLAIGRATDLKLESYTGAIFWNAKDFPSDLQSKERKLLAFHGDNIQGGTKIPTSWLAQLQNGPMAGWQWFPTFRIANHNRHWRITHEI